METRKKSAQYLREAEVNLDLADRDIQATHELFQHVQQAVMLEHAHTPWTAEAYETMMRAYRGMVVNILYSGHGLPGGKFAAALPITESAMEFYQQRTDHTIATFNYYLAAAGACLEYAADRVAARLLTGNASTEDVVLLRKSAKIAEEMLAEISLDIIPATAERRAIADGYAKLSHIYRALGEQNHALRCGSAAVTMLGVPDRNWEDHFVISGIYGDLAETFASDPVSHQFFTSISNYFFGGEETLGELGKIVHAYRDQPDDSGLRHQVLEQALKLVMESVAIKHHASTPNTSSPRVKNSLFQAQHDGYSSSFSLSDEEESLSDIKKLRHK